MLSATKKKVIYMFLAFAVMLTAVYSFAQPRQSFAGETEYLNDLTTGKNMFDAAHYFTNPDKTNVYDYTFDAVNNSFSYDLAENLESVLTGSGTYKLRPGTYTFSFYLKTLSAINVDAGNFLILDNSLNTLGSVSVKHASTTAQRYSISLNISTETIIHCQLRIVYKPSQSVSYIPLSTTQKINVYNMMLEVGALSDYIAFGSSGDPSPDPSPDPSFNPGEVIEELNGWLIGGGSALLLLLGAGAIVTIIFVRKRK